MKKVFGAALVVAMAIAAPAVADMVKDAEITAINNGGREIEFKAGSAMGKAAVSASRTSIMVKGAAGSRDSLAAGMKCDIEHNGTEAQKIDCK